MIHVDIDGAVATVRIDRPERRNALNLQAVEELDAAFERVDDGAVRAVILCGTDGHFCAGADLKELEDLTFTQRLRIMLDRLADLPLVTIAAISGSCMGLGMQLALACDIRVATHDAKFAVPVAKLGLMVDHWTLERLVATFGIGAARHLVLTAQVLEATDGLRLGFVQELGDEGAARVLADRVATLAPLAVSGSKLGFASVAHRPDTTSYEEAFRRAWQSEDLVEGRAAFAERRPPQFKGA